MFKKKPDGISTSTVQLYATHSQFCQIFAEDENALYLLSLLLTADASKAEQCFVAGLEDSIHGSPVFKEWARSWSKRMIIKNAIQMISPTPGKMIGAPHVSDSETVSLDLGSELTAILQLAPLERFVFVMSVLEGYLIQDCSILLNCTRQYVENAQVGAFQHLAVAQAKRLTRDALGGDAARDSHFLQPMHVA
jgi:hypothetical protein